MGVLRPRFYGRKRRKNPGKFNMEKKWREKSGIFSIFISAFSPYNWEYRDSAFYGRKRRKKWYFLHIHFHFFSMIAEIYMEKKQRKNMENVWTSIIFSIIFSIGKWRMNMGKLWTSMIFSIGIIVRYTGLQMAWSFLTWITPIIKPETANHIIKWYGYAPTKI